MQANQTPFSFALVGYPPDNISAPVPSVNDAGAAGALTTLESYTIPPVVWMFIFLAVGYVGLRMLLEE